MRLAFVIAVTLFASSALGNEEVAAPPAPLVVPPTRLPRLATPTWSVGAGLAFFTPSYGLVGLGGAGGGLTSLSVLTPVAPSVSVERLFSPQFALGLGLEGSVQSNNFNPSSRSLLTGSIGLGVSPRFIMTNPDAPVSFTLYSTLLAGYSGAPGAATVSPAGLTLSPPGSALSVGVGGGFAFELRLLERLSVRVQVHLARLSLTSQTFSNGAFNQLLLGASFIPSPSLELRLYL
jgi:hypothetical protein